MTGSDPVIPPLRSYRKLMDPPAEHWPVFPTFDRRTLAELVQKELADRGERPNAIDERREEYVRDLLLALDEDVRPSSITTDSTRSILQRLSDAAEIDIEHPKHDYLALMGVVVGWARSSSERLGIQLQLDILITRGKWSVNGIHILMLASWEILPLKHLEMSIIGKKLL